MLRIPGGRRRKFLLTYCYFANASRTPQPSIFFRIVSFTDGVPGTPCVSESITTSIPRLA